MSQPSTVTERRLQARRVRVNCQFHPFGGHIRECVMNLSRGGAFIASNGELAQPGANIRLSHTIVSDRIETLEGVARVVRTSESPRGMGVRFVRLTQDSEQTLEGLLDPSTVRPVGGSSLDLAKLRRHAFSA